MKTQYFTDHDGDIFVFPPGSRYGTRYFLDSKVWKKGQLGWELTEIIGVKQITRVEAQFHLGRLLPVEPVTPTRFQKFLLRLKSWK